MRGILFGQVVILGGMLDLLPCFLSLGLLPATFVTVAIFVGIVAYRERWQFHLRSLLWATAAMSVLCAIISAVLRANAATLAE
ncbi:MAG TPA: hypothetical protein VHC22_00730 [Pirellulales bacterium]|nr:hypothetical protein [Pirellulales bacterium]